MLDFGLARQYTNTSGEVRPVSTSHRGGGSTVTATPSLASISALQTHTQPTARAPQIILKD